MNLIQRIARRWADQVLRHEMAQLAQQVASTRSDLDAEQRKVRVLEAERDEMADVIIRNRQRVRAETALSVRWQAEHEKYGRTDQGTE